MHTQHTMHTLLRVFFPPLPSPADRAGHTHNLRPNNIGIYLQICSIQYYYYDILFFNGLAAQEFKKLKPYIRLYFLPLFFPVFPSLKKDQGQKRERKRVPPPSPQPHTCSIYTLYIPLQSDATYRMLEVVCARRSYNTTTNTTSSKSESARFWREKFGCAV